MPAKKAPDKAMQRLIAMGYRRTSRRFGLISRIDRPDWVEFLKSQGLGHAEANSKNGCWEDFYRRVYSKDTLEIGQFAMAIPPSGWDFTGYIEVEGKVPKKS